VFVSYSRKDSEPAAKLVDRLQRSGINVTWDRDFGGGVDFRREIRRLIESVACVIVVWSEASAASDFVMDEADIAIRDNKLVATKVDGFDVDELPVGFRSRHVISVDDWAGVCRSLGAHGLRAEA
jgi:hypothetical protein